jgi:hypothetical protein
LTKRAKMLARRAQDVQREEERKTAAKLEALLSEVDPHEVAEAAARKAAADEAARKRRPGDEAAAAAAGAPGAAAAAAAAAAASGVPAGLDLRAQTSAVQGAGVAHAENRLLRTEISPDGTLLVFKQGEFRLPNGDVYIGETVNGARQGQGTYYFANGDVYVGEFEGGIFHGHGVLRKAAFREGRRDCVGRSFAGGWVKGFRDGRGKFATGFGDFYDGLFKADAYDGQGVMVYANGDRYVGGWSRGKWHGTGALKYANGNSYEGGFAKGLFHGDGMFRYGPAGGSYTGGWRQGKKHGIGKRVFASGAEFEGEYQENEMAGRGIYKSSLGDLYVGTFKDSKFHGEGTLIKCTGDRYQGQFQRGQPCGVGQWEYERGGLYDGEFLAQLRTGIAWMPRPKQSGWMGAGLEAEEAAAAERKKKAGAAAAAAAAAKEEDADSDDEWGIVRKKEGAKAEAAPPTVGPKAPTLSSEEGVGKKKAAAATKKDKEAAPADSPLSKAKRAAGSGIGGGSGTGPGGAMTREERAKEAQRLADMTPADRAKLAAVKKRKEAKKPEDFTAPLLVGSPEDRAFLAAGGKVEGGTSPAADGKPHGKGVRIYADGSRYEGDWYQGMQQGFGVYIGAGPTGVRFEGEWVDGRKEGLGIESYGDDDGLPYLCPLQNLHDGSARCFYDGDWKGGYYWGQGTFTCCDGRQYSGGWRKGKRHGQGRWVMLPAALHYATRRNAEGRVVAGMGGDDAVGEYGQPVRFDDQSRIRVYEGAFSKNKRDGAGKATLNNGDVLEGTFVSGRLNGEVRMSFVSTGKVSYARYKMGTRYAWIAGTELARLLKREEEAARARVAKEEAKVRAMDTLTRSNAFGVRTEAKARAHGKVLAIEGGGGGAKTG